MNITKLTNLHFDSFVFLFIGLVDWKHHCLCEERSFGNDFNLPVLKFNLHTWLRMTC